MDWQARYESGDTPWDKGAPTPVLSELLEKKPLFFREGKRIIVPGCGAGYDSLLIAEQGCHVVGVDIAKTAIEQAQNQMPPSLSLSYVQEDIFCLPNSFLGFFDMVWEHTCFCALHPSLRGQYVESMWRSLKPNASLLGVFFTNPDVAKGEGPPYQSTRNEVLAHFGSHFVLEWEMEPTRFYEGREGREHVMLFRRLADCSESNQCC